MIEIKKRMKLFIFLASTDMFLSGLVSLYTDMYKAFSLEMVLSIRLCLISLLFLFPFQARDLSKRDNSINFIVVLLSNLIGNSLWVILLAADSKELVLPGQLIIILMVGMLVQAMSSFIVDKLDLGQIKRGGVKS